MVFTTCCAPRTHRSRPTSAGSKDGPQAEALEEGWVGNGMLPRAPSDAEPDSNVRMPRPSPRAVMPTGTETLQPAGAAERLTEAAAVTAHPPQLPCKAGSEGGAQHAGEPVAAAKAAGRTAGGCCAMQ